MRVLVKSRLRRSALWAVMTTLLVAGQPRPASAYLKLGVEVDGEFVLLKWRRGPVRYFVTDEGIQGLPASTFQAAVTRAFNTWEAVSSATLSYEFGGFTSARPGEEDGLSTVGFLAAPELDRVLAATSFLVDVVSGELVESDIFFNTSFDWSVSANGDPTRYDVETIALHEIGHFSGLGHSALGETELVAGGARRVIGAESVMFPIAFRPGGVANRMLRADDIAGLSDLYPDEQSDDGAGSISGRITKNGQGVFGAHVVAFNPKTGSLIGSFSLASLGHFVIAGLAPGPYILRIEPIDDADVESFFDSGAVDLDFRAAYYDRFVVVPRGGDSGSVTVTVVTK